MSQMLQIKILNLGIYLRQQKKQKEDLIEKETTTWYPDRELPTSSLSDLEEVYELLEQIVNYEPTDQEIMSSFGTKWHDGL